MRRTAGMVITALVASALALGGPGLGAVAQDKPAATTAKPAISWSRCSDAFLRAIGAKCGAIEVPLDWAHPSLGTVRLAVSRLRHTAPAKDYRGIMLANPGGPGGSGLPYAFLGYLMPDDIRAAYDWIGFDPRGVGESQPALRCIPDYFVGPRPDYDIGLSPENEPLWRASADAYADACASAGGDLLDHLKTTDNVRDMDAIRAALEQPKLNFYGFSYGTYLAQVYATMFPARVGRMVLDGNVDPRRVWYGANQDQDYAFETVIERFFGWVAGHDDVYDLGDTGAEVEAAYYGLRAELTDSPIGTLGPDELTDAMLLPGYVQALWPDLAAALSALDQGDAGPMTGWYEAFAGPGDDNGYAMYLATICTDAPWPPYAQTLSDNTAIDAVAPFFTWGNAWFNAPCSFWSGASAAAPVDVDGAGVPPLLLVSETLDAATPISGSLEVRRRFDASALIAVADGTTHANSLAGNACVDEPIFVYLRTGTVPTRLAGDRADVECAAPPLPEPQLATAETASAGAHAGASSVLWTRHLGTRHGKR